jgi:hypothetical protein
MAIERRSPLPIGRYWIRLPFADARAFEAWTARNKGKVFVERTSEDGTNGWGFYLFVTRSPVVWLAEKFGWPNVAGAEVTRETDLDQVPQMGPTDPLYRVDAAIDEIGRGAKAAGNSLLKGALLIAVVAVVASKLIK